jgi:flavin-dependent dehydrogenase
VIDVVIAGAGPAGSTAAALLAQAGYRVVVFEKERFPRFHIGESLLPIDLPIFERLGFQPSRADFVYKVGAEFIDEAAGAFAAYPFSEGLPGTPGHAWQVERSRFDQALAERAVASGAEIRFGERVVEVAADAARVVLRTRTNADIDALDAAPSIEARYFLDATGQDAFWGRRERTIEPIKGFGIVAVFTHFEGVAEDVSAELEETGNTKVLIRHDGWGWIIPLRGCRVGVGIVTRVQGADTQLLERAVETSPLLRRLTAGASMRPPRLIRNFAYLNRAAYGVRRACIGDAAAFLDPVFSSGVSLAMLGGEAVADRLVPALATGAEHDEDLMNPVAERMRHAYDCFGSLIRSFYHTHLVRHFFFHDDPDLELRAGLISLLAGDVFRDDNKFQSSLLSGRRRWVSGAA